MNIYHKSLASKDVKILEKHFDVISIPQSFTLIYEHHIPFSGLILIDGEVELKKKSELLQKVSEPMAIGVKQLLNNKALRVECFVKKDSRLILLSRNEILGLKISHPELLKLLTV